MGNALVLGASGLIAYAAFRLTLKALERFLPYESPYAPLPYPQNPKAQGPPANELPYSPFPMEPISHRLSPYTVTPKRPRPTVADITEAIRIRRRPRP